MPKDKLPGKGIINWFKDQTHIHENIASIYQDLSSQPDYYIEFYREGSGYYTYLHQYSDVRSKLHSTLATNAIKVAECLENGGDYTSLQAYQNAQTDMNNIVCVNRDFYNLNSMERLKATINSLQKIEHKLCDEYAAVHNLLEKGICRSDQSATNLLEQSCAATNLNTSVSSTSTHINICAKYPLDLFDVNVCTQESMRSQLEHTSSWVDLSQFDYDNIMQNINALNENVHINQARLIDRAGAQFFAGTSISFALNISGYFMDRCGISNKTITTAQLAAMLGTMLYTESYTMGSTFLATRCLVSLAGANSEKANNIGLFSAFAAQTAVNITTNGAAETAVDFVAGSASVLAGNMLGFFARKAIDYAAPPSPTKTITLGAVLID